MSTNRSIRMAGKNLVTLGKNPLLSAIIPTMILVQSEPHTGNTLAKINSLKVLNNQITEQCLLELCMIKEQSGYLGFDVTDLLHELTCSSFGWFWANWQWECNCFHVQLNDFKANRVTLTRRNDAQIKPFTTGGSEMLLLAVYHHLFKDYEDNEWIEDVDTILDGTKTIEQVWPGKTIEQVMQTLHAATGL